MAKKDTTGKKAFLKELEVAPVKEDYKGAGKLQDKVALITGGDSGIGRSVAIHYAREGADVIIVYETSDDDARQTQGMVEAEGRACLLIKGNLAHEAFCKKIIATTKKKNGQAGCAGKQCRYARRRFLAGGYQQKAAYTNL